MTAITQHRTDSAKNPHRHYRLDVQPDLFGNGVSSVSEAARANPARCELSPTLPPTRRKPHLSGRGR